MRLVDVRHEQTAVFAAEATAKLTRRPGLAVLTAGPGVTNGISAVTSAWFNGSPLLVVGGRAPAYRWGTGSLQELDHPPLLAPVTKRAATVGSVEQIATEVDDALRLASAPHRGPVFLDVPMDQFFSRADVELPGPAAAAAPGAGPGRRHVDRRAAGVGAAAGAGHRVGRLVGRRGGGGAAAGGDHRRAGDHQRDGPRHPACRASAAGDAGPFGGLRPGRPGGRRGRPAGLPARLRRLRREGRSAGRTRRTPGRLPRSGSPARRPGRLGLR